MNKVTNNNQGKFYYFYGSKGKSRIALSGQVNPEDNTKMSVGIAKCHKNDIFKKDKARAIAAGRAATHIEGREERKNKSFIIYIEAGNPGKQFSEFAIAYCN